jgi:hypothetical protein
MQTNPLEMAMEKLRIPARGGSGLLTLHLEALKRAYRQCVMRSHPDRAESLGLPKELLEEEFKRVNESYQILLEYVRNRENRRPGTRFTPHPPEKSVAGNFYYRGSMPKRPLRFGEFLYYSGNIDWNTFIQAIVWQMRNRPRFGDIAIKLGYMRPEEAVEVMRLRRLRERFGDTAIRLGHISNHQMFIILGRQRFYAKPIGSFFQDNGRLTREALEKKLAEQVRHNARFR